MFVVPLYDREQLTSEKLPAKWDQRNLLKQLFQCQDESFDDGDGIDCLLHLICAMDSNPFK